MLDLNRCEAQIDVIEKLTMSGKLDLDKDNLKELWELTGTSQEHLKFCHDKLMEKLRTKQAQVRYSAFQLVDDLFHRSEFYRDYFLSNAFEEFAWYTLMLKREKNWNAQLSPKEIAKKLKKDALRAIQKWREDFVDQHPQVLSCCDFIVDSLGIDINEDEAIQVREETRLRELNNQMLAEVRAELRSHGPEIREHISQTRSCLSLLFEGEEYSDSDSDVPTGGFRLSRSMCPRVIRSSEGKLSVVVNKHNENVVEKLRELVKYSKKRLLPRVYKWVEKLEKTYGNVELREQVSSMRESLNDLSEQFHEIELVDVVNTRLSSASDTDDDDLVDVEPVHYGVEPLEILKECQASESNCSAESSDKQKSNDLTKSDLQAAGVENQDDQNAPSSSHAMSPTVAKWSCRAAFPSGKLCPRKDLKKCPFHGPIIGRDKLGIPTDPQDRLREEAKQAELDKNRVPDWQEPAHLAEMKRKTGMDLKLRRSKRGKLAFSEKYPDLVDVKKKDPRERIAKKIFKKKPERGAKPSSAAGSFSVLEKD